MEYEKKQPETKEEPEALKNEVEEQNTKPQELSEEELEQVAAGVLVVPN